MSGVPVVVVPKGGIPVRSVDGRAPVMTIADNGIGIPITYSDNGAPFVVQGQAWTPDQLFNGGQPGFWSGSFAPTSLRLFQDAAGTTPANQAGQPVGKVVLAAGTVDATQATALSRPTLARWPKGGRRNLLTWTEDFSNAAWGKINSSVNAAPEGFVRVTPAATEPAGRHLVNSGPRQTVLNLVGQVSISVEAKAEGAQYLILGISNGAGYLLGAGFDLRDGVAQSPYGHPAVADTLSSKITPLSDGVFRCTLTANLLVNSVPFVHFTASTSAPYPVGSHWQLADGASGILIRNPQVELGPNATPYQRVTTANDVTEAGVPDVWHLWNDGGDSLPAILPAGSYEIAWVNHLGAVSYASVTSDGTAGTNLLRAERMADVLAREGAFTPEEKSALEFYWHQRYEA